MKIVWKTWLMLYMLISTLLFYLPLVISIVLLKNYALTYKIYRVWAWSICLAIGVWPQIFGLENLPKNKSFILAANHSSQLDIVVSYTKIANHFAFLAKNELKKAPLFNINFKGMNVTVDRKSMVSGGKSMKACASKLQQGISLLIFPEGTRSANAPKMRNFKTGAFKLAIENQVDIVPMAFMDNYKRLQGGKGIYKGAAGPGKSRMVILPSISTLGLGINDIESLKAKTFKAIDDALKNA